MSDEDLRRDETSVDSLPAESDTTTKTTTTTTTTASTIETGAMPPNLTLILAATPSLGIGKNGKLPWPMLKKELAYFARVTKRVPSHNSDTPGAAPRINAVIMGRKTWDSIPETLRPLKGRLNVVITRDVEGLKARLASRGGLNSTTTTAMETAGTETSTSKDLAGNPTPDPTQPLIHSSLFSALSHLQSLSQPPSPSSTTPPNKYQIHKIFCIGGSSLYTTALAHPLTTHILLTKINKDYPCDTFFPQNIEQSSIWRRAGRREMEDFIGEEVGEGKVEEEGGVRFEFCLFVKDGGV
ncbi:hypothetical protein J1614_008449 [Plenodomus biglobosus]|nr:hypothetical protein J1614_008449 [Plenodomus biglobosus]